ncbi:MAG: hypothetical protein M1817_000367 [Caeruleum heppii]|nr:MAG: hypothetical protein M1817_000367 [Caeruleum heppii]
MEGVTEPGVCTLASHREGAPHETGMSAEATEISPWTQVKYDIPQRPNIDHDSFNREGALEWFPDIITDDIRDLFAERLSLLFGEVERLKAEGRSPGDLVERIRLECLVLRLLGDPRPRPVSVVHDRPRARRGVDENVAPRARMEDQKPSAPRKAGATSKEIRPASDPLQSNPRTKKIVFSNVVQVLQPQCQWCNSHPEPINGRYASTTPSSSSRPDETIKTIRRLCADCGTWRARIITHPSPRDGHPNIHTAFHPCPRTYHDDEPSLTDHQRRLLFDCYVCHGHADVRCDGCPLRVCLSCETALTCFYGGKLEELIEALGKNGVHAGAELLIGHGATWAV